MKKAIEEDDTDTIQSMIQWEHIDVNANIEPVRIIV